MNIDSPPSAARARSIAFAVFSYLMASPNDLPFVERPLGLEAVAAMLSEVQRALPYSVDFDELRSLIEMLTARQTSLLGQEYGRLFEVGQDGPPVPIREELTRSRPLKAKEELVRFYEYFGYRLKDEYAWAPDHLSVQLEFLHFLAYQESLVKDEEERLSYQLAQRDFLKRHVLNWYDQLQRGVLSHTASSYYRCVVATLGRFLRLDLAWQENRLKGEVNHGASDCHGLGS